MWLGKISSWSKMRSLKPMPKDVQKVSFGIHTAKKSWYAKVMHSHYIELSVQLRFFFGWRSYHTRLTLLVLGSQSVSHLNAHFVVRWPTGHHCKFIKLLSHSWDFNNSHSFEVWLWLASYLRIFVCWQVVNFLCKLPIKPDSERVKKFLLILMYHLLWMPVLSCMCTDAVLRDFV